MPWQRQVTDTSMSQLKRAVEVVKAGGVVAYPTESFYGLGADPFNPNAVTRVFQIKGRDTNKPILLIVASKAIISEFVEEITPIAKVLMDRFWPGPLTILFKAKRHINPLLHGGTMKIGLRLSPHPVAHFLADALGAITATSANPSGMPAVTSSGEVKRVLGDKVDLVLEWGPPGLGIPSTVVDATGEELVILREGQISEKEIQNVKERV